jgi:hypothetical protein
MSSQIIDCPELVGKTVSSLKLYPTDNESAEMVIEFTDGTSFCSSYESRATLKACLMRTSAITPETLKSYCE